MGVPLPRLILAKQIVRQTLSRTRSTSAAGVPKGHFAVYVGESHKRFVIPISFLKHPLFQELLSRAAEEYGFEHPTGGLSLPCEEEFFMTLTSHLSST